MASIRLGDLLVKARVISDTQLKAALADQERWGGRLGEILVRMNVLTEEMLVKALAKQLNVQAVGLDAIQSVPAHVRVKVPAEVARSVSCVPLQVRDEGKTLVVAMSEPQNLKQLDTIRSVSRCSRIIPQVAGREAIRRAFGRFYEGVAEVPEASAGFKLVDAQGLTIIRGADTAGQEGSPGSPSGEQPATGRRLAPASAEVSAPGGRPSDLLRAVEEAQRKEVTALKAMVELLIEKGVFTRDEYLAKVKR